MYCNVPQKPTSASFHLWSWKYMLYMLKFNFSLWFELFWTSLICFKPVHFFLTDISFFELMKIFNILKRDFIFGDSQKKKGLICYCRPFSFLHYLPSPFSTFSSFPLSLSPSILCPPDITLHLLTPTGNKSSY